MTEPEKKARINSMGWEIASMYPKQRGKWEIGVLDGSYKGAVFVDNIPPGQRPSPLKSGGY